MNEARRLPPFGALTPEMNVIDLSFHYAPACRDHLDLILIGRLEQLRDAGRRPPMVRVEMLAFPIRCSVCRAEAAFEVR
jgi:hypothetical protein